MHVISSQEVLFHSLSAPNQVFWFSEMSVKVVKTIVK